MSSRIPNEFTGMARALMRRVAAVDNKTQAGLDRIEARVRARLLRKPTLRPENVLELERLWAALPATFRLAGPKYERPKKRIRITEVQLNAGTTQAPDWEVSEPNLSVSWVTFEVTARGGYSISHVPMIAIGLHALARR